MIWLFVANIILLVLGIITIILGIIFRNRPTGSYDIQITKAPEIERMDHPTIEVPEKKFDICVSKRLINILL